MWHLWRFFWPMSHLLTCPGRGLWPILKPATRRQSRHFGFTFEESSCCLSLYTANDHTSGWREITRCSVFKLPLELPRKEYSCILRSEALGVPWTNTGFWLKMMQSRVYTSKSFKQHAFQIFWHLKHRCIRMTCPTSAATLRRDQPGGEKWRAGVCVSVKDDGIVAQQIYCTDIPNASLSAIMLALTNTTEPACFCTLSFTTNGLFFVWHLYFYFRWCTQTYFWLKRGQPVRNVDCT